MYKALIIDDEKPVQIAIQKLGNWKYYGIEPPRLAVNGRDGLAAMREFHPDIVFVDMNMPVMDGVSFLQAASGEFPDSQYVLKLRMERAKELLEDEDNKILDIAKRLGYADNHYFSRAFRNYYNISPSQYRKDFLKWQEEKNGPAPSPHHPYPP